MKSRMAALECGLFVCLFKSYSNRPVDPAGESIEVLSSLVKVGTIRTPGPVELCTLGNSRTGLPLSEPRGQLARQAFRGAKRELRSELVTKEEETIVNFGGEVSMSLRHCTLECRCEILVSEVCQHMGKDSQVVNSISWSVECLLNCAQALFSSSRTKQSHNSHGVNPL